MNARAGSPAPAMSPDLLTIPEVAIELGVHKDTLYALARSGQFPPAIQIGGRWRVSRPKLQKYLHGEDGTG